METAATTTTTNRKEQSKQIRHLSIFANCKNRFWEKTRETRLISVWSSTFSLVFFFLFFFHCTWIIAGERRMINAVFLTPTSLPFLFSDVVLLKFETGMFWISDNLDQTVLKNNRGTLKEDLNDQVFLLFSMPFFFSSFLQLCLWFCHFFFFQILQKTWKNLYFSFKIFIIENWECS